MSPPQPGLALMLTALGLTAVTISAGAGAAPPAASVPQSALQACAGIAAGTDRLVCYDRLAGRTVPGAGAQATASPSAAAPASSTAPVTAAALAPAAPAAPPKESFGLYEAEHPKPSPASVAVSLEARVVALGKSASGRTTASLEGGAVWQLDDADPLLAVGETVTITRAAFGSYIMHTPARRTHRVRRLR